MTEADKDNLELERAISYHIEQEYFKGFGKEAEAHQKLHMWLAELRIYRYRYNNEIHGE